MLGAVQAGGAEAPPAPPGPPTAAGAAEPPPKDAEIAEEVEKGGSPKSWGRGKAGRKGGGEAPPVPSPSYWKEGCLQSELIQFHLRKGLVGAAQMHSKGGNHQGDQPFSSSSTPPPMASEGTQDGNGRSGAPEGALSLHPRQQQELQDELEKLQDENETLKVSRRGREACKGCGSSTGGGLSSLP